MDANGNPIEFFIGDGTTHDVKVAPDLINCLNFSEKKLKLQKQTPIFQRNVILNPVITISIGIYIRSDI